MDFLLELLFTVTLGPIIELVMEKPADGAANWATRRSRIPRSIRWTLVVLAMILVIAVFVAIIFGAYLAIAGVDESDRNGGLILLLSGLGVFITYLIVTTVVRHVLSRRKKRAHGVPKDGAVPAEKALRRVVHVVVDRPLGSVHPEHADVVYGVNYGFVPEVVGGDGEAQDAYILGVDTPLTEFDGVVVAVIHRLNDVEDKWVVAPRGVEPTDEEICAATDFQEKFFKSELIRH